MLVHIQVVHMLVHMQVVHMLVHMQVVHMLVHMQVVQQIMSGDKAMSYCHLRVLFKNSCSEAQTL